MDLILVHVYLSNVVNEADQDHSCHMQDGGSFLHLKSIKTNKKKI